MHWSATIWIPLQKKQNLILLSCMVTSETNGIKTNEKEFRSTSQAKLKEYNPWTTMKELPKEKNMILYNPCIATDWG